MISTGSLYYFSLIGTSIAGPLAAGYLPNLHWRFKIPACLILANLIPFAVIALAVPDVRYGSTFGIAMLFGVLISSFLIFPISMIVRERTRA